MTTAPARFKTKPARAMSLMRIFPLPKTMAFGAVATGSMKAQLALIAAGIINSIGLTSVAIAVAASRGINRLAVAVLLVTSVRNVTARHRDITNNQFGHVAIPLSSFAMMSTSPL